VRGDTFGRDESSGIAAKGRGTGHVGPRVGVTDDTVTLSADSGRRPRLPDGLLPEGTPIGRYLIVSHVASGGAGSVYAAYDSVLDRRIALKLLGSPSADTMQTVNEGPEWQRLVGEARILAKLNHPHVVSIYDAGVIEMRSYLAMEFVEGADLGRWIQRHRVADAEDPRDWRSALDLLRQAGLGLEAAHRAGIVHGDFKPANVLVDTEGRVKVSDFGISRVMRTTEEQATTDRRKSASVRSNAASSYIVGSPAYMAPEQFLGVEADVRTDVYGFCATLFEAVYGQRPHSAPSVARLTLLKGEGPPPRPDRPDVPTWLYDVAARGMAVAPPERHASIEAVLDAIGEHLRPARWPWVAAAAFGLAGATAASWFVLRRPHPFCRDSGDRLAGAWDDERRASVRNAIEQTGYAAAEETWQRVEQRLDDHASQWTRHYRQACDAAAGTSPDALSEGALSCLRQRRVELQALVGVLAGIDGEDVLRASRAVTRLAPISGCTDPTRLAAQDEDPSPAAREIDALLAQSRAHHDLGQYTPSTAVAEQALERADGLGDEVRRARALHRVGEGRLGLGKPVEARKVLEEAYYAAVELEDPRLIGDAATALTSAMSDLEDWETGLHWVRLAKIAIAKTGDHSGAVLLREAELVAASGDHERAIDLLVEALLTLDREGAHGELVAAAHNDLGNAYRILARYDEALEAFGEARRIDLEALGALHPNTALNLIGTGGVYLETGRFDEAAEVLGKAVDELTAALGPDHRHVASALSNLAVADGQRGRFDAAKDKFRRAAAIEAQAHGERSLPVARTRMNIALTLIRSGHHADALAELEAIVPIFESLLPPEHPDQIYIWSNIGAAAAHLGDHTRSLDALARARDISGKAFGTDHPLYLVQSIRRGEVLVDAGRPAEAVEVIEALLPRVDALPGEEGRAALARFALARALVDLDQDVDRARALATSARDFMREASPEDEAIMQAWLDAL
jgi:eukaryotic-like serine/threonine-protein kinase